MILVTGAAGLLGSHLVEQLGRMGKNVKAVYRSAMPPTNCGETVQWVKGDILDVVFLENIMEDVSEVYHCAAVVSFHPRAKALMNHTNIEGTANVVNACLSAGISKLLFVSSVAALGRIRQETMIDESMNWSEETSNSDYGKTKYLAEMEVWRGIGEGLNAVIINPVIILGAGDWQKGSSGIFKSAYNEFPWYTDGVSGFVDVADVVKAMVLLMDAETITAERFIICAENHTYREVFTMIANAFHKKPPGKKVTNVLAAIVWRWESVKARITGETPLLTKETAHTALAKAYFDNGKFKRYFPNFEYSPVRRSIDRICSELAKKYSL